MGANVYLIDKQKDELLINKPKDGSRFTRYTRTRTTTQIKKPTDGSRFTRRLCTAQQLIHARVHCTVSSAAGPRSKSSFAVGSDCWLRSGRIPNRVGVAGHVSATGEVLRVSLWQQCTNYSAWQSRRRVAFDCGRQRREQMHTTQICSALPNGTRLAGLRGSHRTASLALSQDWDNPGHALPHRTTQVTHLLREDRTRVLAETTLGSHS